MSNSNNIPTGKTYLWVAFKWNIIFIVVFLLCFVLFKTGYTIGGFFLIALSVFFFVRESKEIGRRARRGIKQAYDPNKYTR